MKTVEFQFRILEALTGLYECRSYKDQSGTYVLASEAKERIKVLEDALKELFQNKHIDLGDIVYKVIEQEGLGWDGPWVKQWGDAVAKARKALEVKP